MRNCEDCGAKLPDEAMVCSTCGSENLSVIIEENQNTKKMTTTKIAVLAVVVIVSLLGLIFYNYFSKSIPVKPVKEGILARESGDVQGFIDSLPEAFRGEYEDEYIRQFQSLEGYNTQYKLQLEEMFGKSYSVNVKVIDIQKTSDVMLAALNVNYQKYSTVFQKAYYVTLKIVISNEEGVEIIVPKTVYSVKVENNWYLFEDFSDEE